MQVTSHFAPSCNQAWLVPENKPGQQKLVQGLAGQIENAVRIMVAIDPDPVTSAGERADRFTECCGHEFRATPVVKIISQRNYCLGVISGNDSGQQIEGRQRIIRRQHHAATGKRSAFLQMQIRDDKAG